MAEIVIPVIWESLDLTDIPASRHAYIADLIQDGRGHQVRKLQLSIRLFPVQNTKEPGILSAAAVCTDLAVQIMSSTPRLEWLEIELCSMNSPHYISKLPHSLMQALASHTQLKHFGITCEGQANHVPFQLDEILAADIVKGLPNLRSLTLHKIGYDTLLATSPLFNVVSSMQGLTKLNILEVQALSGLWTARPIGHDLRALTLVCCHRISPSDLDNLLEMNKPTLQSLVLAYTPSQDHPSSSSTSSRAKYDLPVLHTLSIEAERSHIDNIAYIHRFSSTNLEQLSLRYAAGVKAHELEELLKGKSFKSLKSVEVGRYGIADLEKGSVQRLVDIAGEVGVKLSIGGKSALVPELAIQS